MRLLSISLLHLGKYCQPHLPAEIKVQTSKNYETKAQVQIMT